MVIGSQAIDHAAVSEYAHTENGYEYEMND